MDQREKKKRQDQKGDKQHFRISILVSPSDGLEIRVSTRKAHNEALRQTGDKSSTDKRKLYHLKYQLPGKKYPSVQPTRMHGIKRWNDQQCHYGAISRTFKAKSLSNFNKCYMC